MYAAANTVVKSVAICVRRHGSRARSGSAAAFGTGSARGASRTEPTVSGFIARGSYPVRRCFLRRVCGARCAADKNGGAVTLPRAPGGLDPAAPTEVRPEAHEHFGRERGKG